jgi:hypothetical protein
MALDGVVPNNAPKVTISAPTRVVQIVKNATLSLTAVASDPDGDSLEYVWEGIRGWGQVRAKGANAIWDFTDYFALSYPTEAIVRVTTFDHCGASNSADLSILVQRSEKPEDMVPGRWSYDVTRTSVSDPQPRVSNYVLCERRKGLDLAYRRLESTSKPCTVTSRERSGNTVTFEASCPDGEKETGSIRYDGDRVESNIQRTGNGLSSAKTQGTNLGPCLTGFEIVDAPRADRSRCTRFVKDSDDEQTGELVPGTRCVRFENFRGRVLPNVPPKVTIEVSKPKLGLAGFFSALDDGELPLKAIASDSDGDNLLYTWTVSSGTILGDGPNVIWDLTGVRKRTATVTLEVDDGCGCINLNSVTLTVVNTDLTM